MFHHEYAICTLYIAGPISQRREGHALLGVAFVNFLQPHNLRHASCPNLDRAAEHQLFIVADDYRGCGEDFDAVIIVN